MQARALIPFLKKYISGNPTIVIENMPGAAGMKAVNHAYSTAKPDGLTITAGFRSRLGRNSACRE